MVKKQKPFTVSEQRVIKALIQLDRWATANEVADWADGMSWNTAQKTLLQLARDKIVKKKSSEDNKLLWKIAEVE
jgi:Fe2+ or Zn2+ uptake regulation protein